MHVNMHITSEICRRRNLYIHEFCYFPHPLKNRENRHLGEAQKGITPPRFLCYWFLKCINWSLLFSSQTVFVEGASLKGTGVRNLFHKMKLQNMAFSALRGRSFGITSQLAPVRPSIAHSCSQHPSLAYSVAIWFQIPTYWWCILIITLPNEHIN